MPGRHGCVSSLADQPGLLLLDSALMREPVGRYSFLSADPFESATIQRVSFGVDPFASLRERLRRFASDRIRDLPRFQGGAAGLLSYELGTAFERIPRAAVDEFELPDLAVGFYDWVVAWDHASRRAWIISQGFPAEDPRDRAERAAKRLAFVKSRILNKPLRRRPFDPKPELGSRRLAHQFPAPGLAGLSSNFSRDAYVDIVRRTIEYIRAGDVFQANLSQRLLYPASIEPIELLRRLRLGNPAAVRRLLFLR